MRNGFTLIELLITISIMMVILGGGIASYINFNDRQKVTTSAREIQQLLRSAQVKARVGQTPPGCSRLAAYRVAGANGGSIVELSAVCEEPINIISLSTFTLPSGVTLSNSLAVEYQTLQGGVTGAGTVAVTAGAGYNYEFAVDAGGAVSVGGFTEN